MKSPENTVSGGALMRLRKPLILSVWMLALWLPFPCKGEALFQAHYNKSLDADYSVGKEGKAEIIGAKLTEGGKGYPFQNSQPSPEAADIGFSPAEGHLGIRYPLPPSLDLRHGTLEMFVKTGWDGRLPQDENPGPEHTFADIPLEAGGAARIELYVASKQWGNFPTLVFLIYDGENQSIASVRFGPKLPWLVDTWHHLSASWTPTELKLFVDGKLVANTVSEKPVVQMRAAGTLEIGNSSLSEFKVPANALIDEVRLNSTALFQDVDEIAVPNLELTAQQLPIQEEGSRRKENGQMNKKEPDLQKVLCYRTQEAPKIDGDLSDQIWQKLPRATGFVDITPHHRFVPQQTRFSVCYDEQNIYLGIFCEESLPEQIRATMTQRDGNVFSDDSVEIYLDPDRTGQRYVQLACNTLGTQYDGMKTDGSWNGEWRSGVKRVQNGWSLEVAMPFATLNVPPPKGGETWRLNLARNRLAGQQDPLSSWSVLTGGFHAPREFRGILFAPPATVLNRDDERQWNSEYLRAAEKEVKAALVRAEQELRLSRQVAEAVKPKEIRNKEASVLADIGRLGQQVAEGASLDDLNHARQIAGTLTKEVEELALAFSQTGVAGPVKLPRALKPGIRKEGDYWFLMSNEAVFAVDGKTGAVVGIWDRKLNRRYVSSSYDIYTIETLTDITKSDERLDEAQAVPTAISPHSLTPTLVLLCHNTAISGILLRKEYVLESGGRMLTKRLSVEVEASPAQKTLLAISSRTVFDEAFRRTSYYHRILPVSCTGGAEKQSTVSAAEVASPLLQRAGWLSSSGWSQFVMVNPQTQTGIAQYLFKINDQFVWNPYSLNMSYWTPYGWEMGWAATFLTNSNNAISNPQSLFSSEVRYHLFRGDKLKFHSEYLGLLEMQAVRRSYPIHPAIAKMRYQGLGDRILSALSPSFPELTPRFSKPYNRLRSDEVMVKFDIHHNLFGYFPSSDGEALIDRVSVPEIRYPVADVRRATARLKEKFPRLLNSTYWFPYEVHPDAPIHQEHPEWIVRDKQGKPVPVCLASYGGDQANFSPEFRHWWVEQCVRFMDYCHFDYIYLDNGGGFAYADWGRGAVVQATDYMNFLKELHEACASKGKFVFINGDIGHLFTDLSFIEVMGDWGTTKKLFPNWRDLAEILMMYKLYQPKGAALVSLFWMDYRHPDNPARGGDNHRHYANSILKLSLRPTSCYYDYHEELKTEPGKGTMGSAIDWGAMYYWEEAYHATALEMGEAELVDVGLEPAWWRDFETDIEAYALQQGPAHIFTATSHERAARDVVLSADVQEMGFKAGARTFLWQFGRRDDYSIPRRAGPPPEGWDKLFTSITCTSHTSRKRREQVEMPKLEPEFTRLAMVTQVPAVLYSVEGQRTQLLLPQSLGCKVEGLVDEKQRKVTLSVNADKPVQILVWCPKAWATGKVTVRQNDTVHRSDVDERERLSFGEEQFLLIDLLKGTSEVLVSGK